MNVKLMRMDVDIMKEVNMNYGLVSAGTAQTNRKYQQYRILGILFGWAHGRICGIPWFLSVN